MVTAGGDSASRGGYSALELEQVPKDTADGFEDSRPAAEEQPQRESSTNEDEEATSAFPIPSDAYGGAILALIQDAPRMFTNCNSEIVVRTVFAFFLLFLNLILQASITYFIANSVVAESVRNVQRVYQQFHANAYNTDGEFVPEIWEEAGYKGELCQIAMSSRIFYYCTLFLWTILMLGEFRTSQRLLYNIMAVPHCTRSDQMMESPESPAIHRLTTPVRFLLITLVCIPKMLISLGLLWTGWRWLSATMSFESLVMNSVAMAFVTSIDEMVYEFGMPQVTKQDVACTTFEIPGKKKTAEETRWEEKKGYLRSSFYQILAAVLVVAYAEIFQTVLPAGIYDVKAHCSAYTEHMGTPICYSPLEARLRGIQQTACYPYGMRSGLDET